MKTIIGFFLLLLSTHAIAAPMSENEFTRHFVDRASTALVDVHFQIVQPLQLKSKVADNYELTAFLGNAYSQYTSNPKSLDFIIDSQIQSIKSQRDLLGSKTAKSIFAIIKPANYINTVRQQLTQAGWSGKELPLVFEQINDELYAFFVFDSTNGMRMISKKDLVDINVDMATIRSIATQNLSTYFDKKGLRVKQLEKIGSAKVYAISLDENYEASILLLSKYWNKQTFNVQGQQVAYVPARNLVLVTGSNDTEGMRIAGLLASSAFKELGYAISPKGFVNENGNWRAYQP